VRATVDRAGLDPQGRLPKVQIRRIRKGDLSRVRDVFEQSFGDFLERQLGTRPRQAFNGAQYVHHRWLMEPWGCFVAEEDGSKLVGAALAATWGSLGLLGPVAVLTHYHNQSIAQQLIRAAEEFFEENKATLHGAVSYATSAKHLAIFHKFGYRPKSLLAVMSRAIERPGTRSALPRPPRGTLTVRRFSTLEETKKKAALLRFHRITNAVCKGMDLAKEVEIAIYHTPGVSEAPAGSGYVKFLAIDPKQRKVEHLEQLVGSIEDLAQEQGLSRVILPVYLRYWQAYSTLVKCGYQVDQTMVRMQKGKQEDYEDPADLVLDDWR